MGAEAVGQPAADGAEGAARQREAGGEQRRLGDREAVFVLEILRHPDRQRREAAEHDRVILAVFPDARIAQHRELLPHRGTAPSPAPGSGAEKSQKRTAVTSSATA